MSHRGINIIPLLHHHTIIIWWWERCKMSSCTVFLSERDMEVSDAMQSIHKCLWCAFWISFGDENMNGSMRRIGMEEWWEYEWACTNHSRNIDGVQGKSSPVRRSFHMVALRREKKEKDRNDDQEVSHEADSVIESNSGFISLLLGTIFQYWRGGIGPFWRSVKAFGFRWTSNFLLQGLSKALQDQRLWVFGIEIESVSIDIFFPEKSKSCWTFEIATIFWLNVFPLLAGLMDQLFGWGDFLHSDVQ